MMVSGWGKDSFDWIRSFIISRRFVHKPPVALPSQNVNLISFRIIIIVVHSSIRWCNSWFHENYLKLMITSIRKREWTATCCTIPKRKQKNATMFWSNLYVNFLDEHERDLREVKCSSQMVRWCINLMSKGESNAVFPVLYSLSPSSSEAASSSHSRWNPHSITQFYQINANVVFLFAHFPAA